MRIASTLISIGLVVVAAASDLRYGPVYSSHMVLQRSPARPRLWGFAPPRAAVTLKLTPTGTSTPIAAASITTNADGIWSMQLPPVASSDIAHTLVASTSESNATLTDIVIGDVYFCAGQSNMAFTVAAGFNASAELAAAAQFPLIRVSSVGQNPQSKPSSQVEPILPWQRSSSPGALDGGSDSSPVMGEAYFSAVCYFFGREMFRKNQVPVGLIASAYGGSSIAAWMSPGALSKCPGDVGHGPAPATLWNGQVVPILNYTINAVLFYQGETNEVLGQDKIYACRLQALMADWRQQWASATSNLHMPFGIVQIGPSCGPSKHTFATRMGQTAGFGYLPNGVWPDTFMATAMDLPNPPGTGCPYGCVHIGSKQEVARRLALAGLELFGNGTGAGLAPRVDRVVQDPARPWVVTVHFHDSVLAAGGVLVRNGARGFELNDGNGTWGCDWVPAEVQAFNSTSVTVAAISMLDGVTDIRYAFGDTPCPNQKCPVYTKDHLVPLAPFHKALTSTWLPCVDPMPSFDQLI